MTDALLAIPTPPLRLLIVALSVCVGALVMTIINLCVFRRSDARASSPSGSVGVCIPARNEEANIEACVRAVLSSDHSDVRVFVYDDQSSDATPRILAGLKSEDPRVRTVHTKPLESGWVGKQWACNQLGQAADTDWLLFIDADVRLTSDCIRRAVATAGVLKADLLSTFPRQITGSLGESLLVPLIHFILLSYLPFPRMRRTSDPNASAACGQFMLFSREAYSKIGGHGACRDSMHDGVKLPRVVRRAGLRSDLFDGTDVCSCRMYHGFRNTWMGFAKNAFEGLGSVGLLAFITVLHMVGHVLPWLALGLIVLKGEMFSGPGYVALACVLVALSQRLLLAVRFQQSIVSAMLHPLGVVLMTVVQWHSYVLMLTGRRGWRGRTLASSASAASGAT